MVDKVVVVAAEQETQINRLTTRGISIDEAIQRVSAQMPVEEKLPLADWIIRTDTSKEDTGRQVKWVWIQVGKSGSQGD
jgi:dephospho-CoA kinase